MPEDLLNHDERLRLECLAQANVTVQGRPIQESTAADSILGLAARYERFVAEGEWY